MKKLLFTLVFAFAGIFTANAQFWLGGSVNAAFGKHESSFGIAPEAGYSFKGTPWTVACAIDYDYTSDDVYSESMLALTPYVRYTLLSIEKFSLSMDALCGIGVRTDNSVFRVGVRPIIAWMATKKWTAAFSMGFLGYDDMYHDAQFILDFETAAPTFGLYYNF